MKICNACGISKPLPEFCRRKASNDGFAYRCKVCSNSHSSEYHKQKHDEDPKYRARKLLGVSKQNAKARKLEFDIDLAWIKDKLDKGVCELTGLPFIYKYTGKARRNPFAPSLDRVNNSLGYTKENVRVVLWGVNNAIGEYGLETMLPIFKALSV
jgi:hypothetical protein